LDRGTYLKEATLSKLFPSTKQNFISAKQNIVWTRRNFASTFRLSRMCSRLQNNSNHHLVKVQVHVRVIIIENRNIAMIATIVEKF